MVSHIPISRSFNLRSGPRGKMVKGKRRTNRNSKDENAVFNHIDGPKGPKDSRLETKVMNGSLTNNKLGTTGRKNVKETKMSSYFSPSRSLPAADNAQPEIIVLDDDSLVEPDLTPPPLGRLRPSSAPSTPTKMTNGHVGIPDAVPILSTSPKSNVCTRSQALKELQLQSSPNSLLSTQCSGHTPTNSVLPATLSAPTTPTSTSSTPTEDASSPHAGPPTPHKIQALNEERLRLDSPLSPSTALSKLKLTLAPKKMTFTSKSCKARKKLPTQSSTKAASLQTKPEKAPKASTVTALANGEAKPTVRNTQMTNFFPIRRSERKPKTTIIQEQQKGIEEKIKENKEEGLMVKHFGAKGRGVVTTREFAKGEFVVEYIGDLIDMRQAKEREKIYAQDASKGCYNYYFTYQNQQYCIDATEESGYLGRLVNHSRNGNLVTKAMEVDGRPHLILLAKRDLEIGTEVLYDYGDRSKESLAHHPWLAS